MKVTAALAFKMFVSATAFAGLLDMYIVQLLKRFSTEFKSDEFIDRNLNWIGVLPTVRRIVGESTLSYMKSRTLLFPAFEIAFGSLVVISLYRYGLEASFVRTGVFLVIALVLAMVSWHESRDFIAPNIITYTGTVVGVVISIIIGPADTMLPEALARPVTNLLQNSTVTNLFFNLFNSLLGVVLGGGGLWLVGWLWEKFKGVEAMGLGAVKTGMMIGAFCGWRLTLLTIFIAVLSGSLFGVVMMFWRRQRDMGLQLPFPAFLVLGGIIAMLWGTPIVSWYADWFVKNWRLG